MRRLLRTYRLVPGTPEGSCASSHCCVGEALRAELEVRGRARDLPDLEALPVLRADEEVEHGRRAPLLGARGARLRLGNGLAHVGGPPDLRSASSPVASRPQRVTSRTRSLDCTSLRISTRAISWKKRGGVPRVVLDEVVDALAVEGEQGGVHLGLDRGRALGLVAEDAHLAEDRAGLEPAQDLLDAPADLLRDQDDARADEEHLLSGVALAEQHLALAEPALAEARPERDELRFVQVAKEVDLAEKGDVGRLGQGRLRPTWPSASSSRP